MSREFGSCLSGYLHHQIDYAADDLAGGRDAMTRAWAPFFQAFSEVAYAIAASEAQDSGEYDSIMATIRMMPQLQAALDTVKDHVRPFEDVMREAVRDAVTQRPGV